MSHTADDPTSDTRSGIGLTEPARSTGPRSALLVPAVLVLVPAVAVGLLTAGGGLAVDASTGLPDPGALTRYGLPVAKGMRDITAAVTIGALVMVACLLPPTPEPAGGATGAADGWPSGTPSARVQAGLEVEGLRLRVTGFASLTALLWFWSGLALMLFTYADLAGEPVLSRAVRSQLLYFATEFELGRLLALSTLLTALITLGVFFTRSVTSVGVLTLLALAALWPLALTGHAAGSANHDLGANALYVHLVAVCLWVGGLIVLFTLRTRLGAALPAVAARYSTLAGWCFVLVLVSGTASALLRVTAWDQLATSYGALVAAKVAGLAALGAFGWRQRRRLLPTLTADATDAAGDAGRPGPVRAFGVFVLLEVSVMAVVMGAGVALSRTAPPSAALRPVSTVESLLGFPLPPPLTMSRWFTTWQVDTLWAPLSVLAVVGYLVGVRRLRHRGHRWSTGRTATWVAGWVMVLWATSGAPGAYGAVLFSVHMVQHMTLAVSAPILLVLAAPVTLALRTLPRRDDGSMGPREWLIRVVHSALGRFLGSPVVATTLFIASVVLFYDTWLFPVSLDSHTMHLLMVAGFLVVGYLFANALVGIDPGPSRPPYPFRLLLVLLAIGLHTYYWITLRNRLEVLAVDWYRSLDRRWGASLADDQRLGATLGWTLLAIPLLLLAGALLWAWVRSVRSGAPPSGRKTQRAADPRSEAHGDQDGDHDGDHDRFGRTDGPQGLAPRQARD